jgi:hypothetical protein
MGRIEKIFCFFALAYIIIYSFFFFSMMSSPDNFDRIVPFHIFGMILSLSFMIVVVRDVFKRQFKNPNSKAIWAILIIMFWPSVFIYLPKYAFKPRDEIQEVGNNKKYIIGFVVIVIVFFGYMGFSMFSAINNFENQPQTLNSLAASGKNQEIISRFNNGDIGPEELTGNGNWSPLHSATSNNRINTVRLLLEKGANVNQQCECNGDTPLHSAAKNGYFDIIKILIEAGADRSILNDKEKSAYDLATENGFSETADLLKF